MSFNIVIIEGRVGKDPETRSTNNGKKVVSFSVASDTGYGDKQSTLWDNIIAWGDQADFAEKYLKKGGAVRIVGERQSRKWTDKTSGQEKTAFEINVFKISFAEKVSKPQQETRANAQPERRVEAPPQTRTATELLDSTEVTDDDLPW